MGTTKLTDTELTRLCNRAVMELGGNTFWRHVGSGGVYVSLGVSLWEETLMPMVRYYPHGKRGFEFCRPLTEFLSRFESTTAPLWTGTPCDGR